MAGGGGSSESGEPEFQIAPMIDVLLVLLVFFMSITSAEVLKVDQNIVLPVSPNAKKREAEMSKHEMAVNVRWDDKTSEASVNVDDRDYPDLTQLVPYLQERVKRDPKVRVVIRGDRLLPAIEIQRVMNVIGEGGIADISFAASNK
ncbi:MAG: biopolymer transporter ExbD [Verrucomicrobia bacterium]|jgi:biopolymer transport protein ExbD|nr:biopolymer transporter ExbD [Verrucomicrobiota bacterium]